MRFWLAAGVAVVAALFVTGAQGATRGDTGVPGDARSVAAVPPVANPFVSAPADVVVSENVGFVDFTVSLSAPGLSTVSVDWLLEDGTATGGLACDNDYASDRGNLTFLAGDTTKVVHVQILDCPVAEHFERFTLHLFNNSFIARANTGVGIVDNDTVVASPSIVVHDVVVDEQAGSALVTVLLGGYEGQASASTVTVHYATSDGTATAGADYTAVNDTLSFAPGQVAKTFEVPILDDGLPEPAEDFSLTLNGATGGATIGKGAARIVIGPSDAPATAEPFVSAQPDVVVGESDGLVNLTVSLSAPGLNPVSVSWILDDGTATGGAACDKDYVSDRDNITFLPGETTKVLHVQILDCPVVEGFETFTLDLFNNSKLAKNSALVTIVDRTVTLNNIAVTPANPTIAKGTNRQFSATGTYSNTVSLDLTSTVVWTSANTAVARIGTGLFDSGGLAHAQSQGTSTITATLGAFNASTLLTVGPPVLAGITVTPANPTIVTAADQQFTATGNLTDSTTTDLTGTANWSSATQTVATIAAGGLAHAVAVGSSLISASFGGITGSTTLTVGKANQMITFAPLPDRTFGDADFAVSATSTSNLTVTFNASGNCTVSGTTVHVNAAGSCTITASQTGNANYNAATSVPRTFQIAKANQTITINTHAPATAAGGSSFSVGASAPGGSIAYSSSGACSNSGSFFTTASGGGTCTVKYDQAGNANYNAAPEVTESVSVTAQKLSQTITFGAPANKTYGDADFTVSATASSGLPVSFAPSGNCTMSGAAVHLGGAGSCTVTASQAGDATYNAATSVSRTFSIAKASQTISFGALSNKTLGDADFAVSATASSGLAVSFAPSGPCTVSGSTVHLTDTGSCTITASQAGNVNYNAASPVTQIFRIESNLTPPASCNVPSLIGTSLAAAKKAITGAGCGVGTVTYTYSKRKKGTVVSQSRRAGAVVAADSTVDFVVSAGPVPKVLAEAVITNRCTRITARLLLARNRLGDLGDPKLRDPVGQVLCGTFVGKRSRAMAVTLAIPSCGRTGSWVVFRWTGRAWKVVMKQKHGADLAGIGSQIRETQFVFRSGDGHCSPTGGTRSRAWHWNGRRLVAGPWKRSR
ncbi:MAG TPA: Calx-beta domain-containing protein [Gaiellaceae bacterium]